METPEHSGSVSPDNEDDIAIGVVGKPVGLDGWCRLFPTGDTLKELRLPLSIQYGFKKPVGTVILQKIKVEPKGMKALFSEFESREAVDILKNQQLFIKESQLPQTSNDEYYHFELVGMEVYYDTNDSEIVGTVLEVHNYPTVDAVEIEIEGEQYVLPLNKDTILVIDKSSKKMVVSAAAVKELL